jgi:hypothetical protein
MPKMAPRRTSLRCSSCSKSAAKNVSTSPGHLKKLNVNIPLPINVFCLLRSSRNCANTLCNLYLIKQKFFDRFLVDGSMICVFVAR